jgi:hypothetical protein
MVGFFGPHKTFVCQRTREALDRAAKSGWVCDLYLWNSDGSPRFVEGSLSTPAALDLLAVEDPRLFGDISLCKLDKYLGSAAVGTDEQPSETLVDANGVHFLRVYLLHTHVWATREARQLGLFK